MFVKKSDCLSAFVARCVLLLELRIIQVFINFRKEIVVHHGMCERVLRHLQRKWANNGTRPKSTPNSLHFYSAHKKLPGPKKSLFIATNFCRGYVTLEMSSVIQFKTFLKIWLLNLYIIIPARIKYKLIWKNSFL